MISIVHGYERSERPALFDEMFRQRKKVFIDQKKWDLKPIDGEFEYDEFDRDDAVYVCSLLPDGSLAGSARFLNTTTEHMAGSVFQGMFPGLMIGRRRFGRLRASRCRMIAAFSRTGFLARPVSSFSEFASSA